MKKYKIYISGQITGLPKDEYISLFSKAEETLRAKGYDVVNPLRNGLADCEHWQQQMKADIRLLLECDAIYMLPNWECSRGAELERGIAEQVGLVIQYEKTPKLREVKDAIHNVMGVHFHDIVEDNRNRWHVYARMIYAHHCKVYGESINNIAGETKHDHSTISYYLRKYDTEYRYNPEFRAAALKVATLVSEKLRQTKEY